VLAASLAIAEGHGGLLNERESLAKSFIGDTINTGSFPSLMAGGKWNALLMPFHRPLQLVCPEGGV
jgi:hypothetical protein